MKGPSRRETKPLPRDQLAPTPIPREEPEDEEIEPPPSTRPALEETEALARRTAKEAITQAICPVCRGEGMVAPEIADAFECFCVERVER